MYSCIHSCKNGRKKAGATLCFAELRVLAQIDSRAKTVEQGSMGQQNPPYAQAKLVRVIKGSVLDVAVDLRKNSPTYGNFIMKELNEENHLMMYLPEGIAHGFITLKNNTIFSYKCSNYYSKES